MEPRRQRRLSDQFSRGSVLLCRGREHIIKWCWWQQYGHATGYDSLDREKYLDHSSDLEQYYNYNAVLDPHL